MKLDITGAFNPMERRPRRNRKNESVRSLVRETIVRPEDIVCPLFLEDGNNKIIPINSMPGINRYSIDTALKEIDFFMNQNVTSFILFPAIEESKKDKIASYSYHPDNFYLKAIQTFKKEFPEVCIITDVAMDPYSSDGHDGFVENGEIINDKTLDILGKMALAQAEAGADILGPSDMMDGRVRYIRKALDNNDYTNVSIMSYTAKYASAFYGPFRDALDSSPKFGDKKTYQMDPANRREALLEAQLDFSEGADYLMVKPALSYLDIISDLKANFHLPIVAYNVSGEYSMVKAAAERGWVDGQKIMYEVLTSIKRAGADIIITYFAKDFVTR
jgi:porphobilinogen synthase